MALVESNRAVLTLIKEGVSRGEEVILAVGEDANISSEQYSLRRILASADRHPTACRGEFANLGQAVTLRIIGRTIIVRIKSRISLTKALPTIETEIDRLESFSGEMEIVTFSSSLEPEQIVECFSSSGWDLLLSTKQENEDGTVSFAVERITSEASVFSRLS